MMEEQQREGSTTDNEGTTLAAHQPQKREYPSKEKRANKSK